MLTNVMIQPIEGINYVQNPSWAFCKVIIAIVEDAVYDILTAPGNRACQYISAEGKVLFNDNFNGMQRVQLLIKSTNALT